MGGNLPTFCPITIEILSNTKLQLYKLPVDFAQLTNVSVKSKSPGKISCLSMANWPFQQSHRVKVKGILTDAE